MPASKVDTFDEGLQRIARVVQETKLIADADLPFLIELETMILERYKQPQQQMERAGLMPSGAQNPMGNGALGLGGGGGMSAPPPSFLGAGAPPGVMQAPGGPNNAAEMQRVLSVPQ